MHKFEIPLYIWLNTVILFAAIGYVWGKVSGHADFQRTKAHSAHLPA